MRLIVLGAPGAGKGTHAEKISAKYNIAHLSTGEILRANIKAGTPLGKQVEGIIAKGELVPDKTVIQLMKTRMEEEDCKNGFLLDGFPRTIAQAEALSKIADLDLVLNIDTDFEDIIERLALRGREDDKPEIVRARLAVYEKQTAPLIAWYKEREKLVTVSGDGTIEEVSMRVFNALDANQKKGV